MPTYRYQGVKLTTEQVGGKWYAHGVGQAATGSTEQEAISKVKPQIRDANKRQSQADAERKPVKPKRYRVKLATGDEYTIEAFSLREARDEANARLQEKHRRMGHY